MDERQAHEFYSDPSNQIASGPAVRRVGNRLSATVPVRFPPGMIDAVKRLADRDGVTVSSWIRRLVAREVMRRQPPTVTTASNSIARYVASSSPGPSSETLPPPAPDRLKMECVA